jgi:mRNA-degrading endonuclease RelE of RelBE toxin-antitoxin system
MKDRISMAIDEIVASPFSGVNLRGELEGRLRWRVGRYRIIYMIDEKPKLIVFLDVGLRKNIYE